MSDRIADIRKEAKGLLRQRSQSDERVQVRVDHGSILPIYIGRSFPAGSFNAVIRSVDPSDLPSGFRQPEIQGLAIHWMREERRADAMLDIVMELQQSEAIEVFIVFIARLCEIVEQCTDSKSAVGEALGQIELWRQFFAGVASQALSETRQTGLFGELTMLGRLIENGLEVESGVKSWTGASATNQDFEFNRIALEVKSTTSVDANEIAVNNIRQLDTKGLDRLYLARFSFDVRRGEESTLPAIVSDLRKTVSSGASHMRTVFEQKLLNAGYRDEHATEYGNRSYTLRGLDFYSIGGKFPRLEEDGLPDGVKNVKYRVNLHGCSEYREDADIAIDEVINASD